MLYVTYISVKLQEGGGGGIPITFLLPCPSGKLLPCLSLRTFQTPGCCLCHSHFLLNLILAGFASRYPKGP